MLCLEYCLTAVAEGTPVVPCEAIGLLVECTGIYDAFLLGECSGWSPTCCKFPHQQLSYLNGLGVMYGPTGSTLSDL